MKRYKLACSFTGLDIFFHGLGWLVLILVTFGLALPFFAYSFLKFVINGIEIHEVTQVQNP